MTDRVVFWDFDGTLAYRDGKWSACLLECLAQVGGSGVSLEDLRPHLRHGFPWHEADIGHCHLHDADSWWAHLLPRLVDAYTAAGVDGETAQAAGALIRERYIAPESWTVFPDSGPALATLREEGWRNIVLSNHVPELPEIVGSLGLDGHIDRIFTSARIGWEKPNARFFAHALQATRARHAWMIGDNPVADIAGAEAAGIPAILVRAGDRTGLDRAVARIRAGSLRP